MFRFLEDLGQKNPNELGIRFWHIAETGFNLVLAVLRYHLKCLIVHNMDSVYTDHKLMVIFSSINVSKENKLDYDINYRSFPSRFKQHFH